MTVVRLPTAAKRKVRCPHLTGAQLAARGIRRILPDSGAAPAVPAMLIAFEPTNATHVGAWNTMVEFGKMQAEWDDRS